MKSKFVTIEIDGAEYPVCFNINALREIEQVSGKSIGEIEGYAKTIEGLTVVSTIGLNHGRRVSGDAREKLTVDQVGDLFDLDGLAGIVNVIAEFLPDQKKSEGETGDRKPISTHEIEAIALGELGMPETEFFNSSLRAVAFRISAHYDRQNRHEIEEWKRIRWQTSILLNIQLAQKDRITPEKLLPLPGDEKKPAAAPQPTPHEYAKFLIDQFNR